MKHPKFDDYVQCIQCGWRKEFYETILWDIVEAKIAEKERPARRAGMRR